jgi:putative ABC transport system permease protein
VTHASISGFLPAGPTNSNVSAIFPGRQFTQDEGRSMNIFMVDEDYVPTFGIEMASGRNFSKAFATDTAAIILNESAALSFGWADPIGKEISTFGQGMNEIFTYQVIGVVKDFNFSSLRERVKPMVMLNRPSRGSISFKVNTTDMSGFLQTLEAKWNEFAPGHPFSYSFMDERFESMYNSERRIRTIFGVFSGLAIFIACLGLFGLATFVAEQRTKEIGIRKVLGASVPDLVGLLSKDFARLVVIAFVVAAPVAWYVMQQWLQDFEYRVTLGWQTFAIAGVMALGIALLTVSFQAVKAALANPVKSLRSE